MTTTSCSCFLWWLTGMAWHGGMIAAVTAFLWVRPNAVGALTVASVYLVLNLCLLRFCWRYEKRKQEDEQQQQEQQPEQEQAEASSSTPETTDAVAQDIPSALPGPSSRMAKSKKTKMNIPLYLSLLHLFTNLSLAVPGALVALLFIPCQDDQNYQPPEQYWATNTSQLSAEVIEWMKHPELRSLNAFVQQASTGDVYLTGSWEGSDDSLYVVPVGQMPRDLGYHHVFDLTAVSDNTLCFSQVDFGQGGYYSYDPKVSIGCGNAADGFTTARVNQKSKHRGGRHENVAVFHLQGIQGLLWFRLVTESFSYTTNSHLCNFYYILDSGRNEMGPRPDCPWDSFAVLSLNTTTMEVTTYSTRVVRVSPTTVSILQPERSYSNDNQEQEDDEDDADAEGEEEGGEGYYETETNEDGVVAVDPEDELVDDFFEDAGNDMDLNDDEASIAVEQQDAPLFCRSLSRRQAAAAIFLSSLPLVISGARSWIKFAVPSASISLFTGLGLLWSYAWAMLEPWDSWEGLWVWLCFATPVWTLVCTYQLVVNPRVSRAPLWWSLYLILTTLLLVLFFAEFTEMSHPQQYFGYGSVPWTFWAMELVLLDLPILIIAILTDSKYFFVLALVGFASLSCTIAWELTDPPMSYLYIGIALILVLALFFCLYRWRYSLHQRLVRWLSACARHTCAVEAYDDDADGSSGRGEVDPSGLLDAQVAEPA